MNYNAGDLLINCVDSILKSEYNNFEIIIVDNVSNDDSHKNCKEKFPSIKLIENEKNLGYCEGNNVGVRNSTGDFIVILNPDTVVEPAWLNELIDAYEKFGDGIYQPKILSLNEKNVLQSTGNMIHLFGFGYSRDLGVIDENEHDKIEQIGYAAGTCLFTSTKILHSLELFDPFIFLYHDDLDLGWRAAQQGINSYYVPRSIIYHVKSYNLQWSSKKFFWLERNRKYCLMTHYSKNTYKKIRLWLILTDILIWFVYISKGFLAAKIEAEKEIKKNKQHIKKRYFELEKKKKISDVNLIKNFSDTVFVSSNISGGVTSSVFNFVLAIFSRKARQAILKN